MLLSSNFFSYSLILFHFYHLFHCFEVKSHKIRLFWCTQIDDGDSNHCKGCTTQLIDYMGSLYSVWNFSVSKVCADWMGCLTTVAAWFLMLNGATYLLLPTMELVATTREGYHYLIDMIVVCFSEFCRKFFLGIAKMAMHFPRLLNARSCTGKWFLWPICFV